MCLAPQADFRRSSRNFREGVSAGTGLDRLNMQDLQALARPISFEELENGFSAKLRPRLRRIPSDGSVLPPKTLGAFVDRIVELDGSVAGRSARFLDCRLEALRRHGRPQRKNLGQLHAGRCNVWESLSFFCVPYRGKSAGSNICDFTCRQTRRAMKLLPVAEIKRVFLTWRLIDIKRSAAKP